MIIIALFISLYCALPAHQEARTGFLRPESSFVFELECGTAWSEFKCEQAKISLKNVGELIGQQLLFKTPVKICMAINATTAQKIGYNTDSNYSKPASKHINRFKKGCWK